MPFGSPHRHCAECASTNDLARAWALSADDPAPQGALVSADFQTRGRGRRGRQWQAQPGESVLMSLVLRPAFDLAEAWQLAFVAALSVSDVVRTYAPNVLLKWPNDILVQGNKAGGVLVETGGASAHGWAAIVGIGVNVSQTGFDNADTYLVPPTSLRIAAGHAPPTSALVGQIALALEARMEQHAHWGWEATRGDWRARMARGVALQRGQEQGIFDDLEPDGQARVQGAGGTFTRWATVDPEETPNLASIRV